MREIDDGIPFRRKRNGRLLLEFIIIIGFFSITKPADALPSIIYAPQYDDGVCRTKVCKDTATLFLNNMNKNVDPCDDFYQYACGNFIKNTKLQEYESIVSSFSALANEIQKKLNRSLSSVIHKNDDRPLRLLKTVYQSCMNTDKIEKLGLSEITDKIKSLGGWPVVDGDAWDEAQFDWLNVVHKSQQIGFESKFFYNIDKVAQMSGLLMFEEPSFSINSAYFQSNLNYTIDATYLKFITAIAKAFGAKKDHNTMYQMSKVLEFMRELKKIPEASNNELKTIAQLRKEYPSIPWLSYINAKMPENFTIPENTTLYVNLGFVLGLESLLGRTPKKIIANYAMTEVVLSVLPYLNNEVRAHSLDFWSTMSGVTKHRERWQQCIRQVEADLPIAISSVYIREHFSREIQPTNDVKDIFRHIKETFGEMIEQSNWLDYDSKVYALAKIQAMADNIGYPEGLLDDKKLREYYKDLELSKSSYVKSLMLNTTIPKSNDVDYKLPNMRKKLIYLLEKVDEYYTELDLYDESYLEIVSRLQNFNRYKSIARVINDDDEEWEYFAESATVINAFYMFRVNEIIIPAAAMHGNFFNKDRPKYVNYGTFGMVLGHEMSHGFDPNDINLDKNGEYKPWLTSRSQFLYDRRSDCIADQYSNYLMKDVGMKVNGTATLGESFADLVGTKVAYGAYMKWVKEYGKEQKLPGIDRSPEQLFWLSTANVWCKKIRPLELKDELVTNEVHAPAEARINLSLKNNPQFAEDFKCEFGSNMNPPEKCQVF